MNRYILIASIVVGNLMSSTLHAQSCDFQISPDANCYSRLSTQTNSQYGSSWVEFRIIDSGDGGLDYNWYKITNNQCWGTGHFSADYTVPADGSAYKVTVSQGSLICMVFSFSASAPAPPPAPIPLTPHVVTCSSGPTTLSMPPGPGYNWTESNGTPLNSNGMQYLSTGEAYVLNTAESDLTIYHGLGPKSFSFSVRNGESLPATLSLSVATNEGVILNASDQTLCGQGTVTLSASGPNLTDFRWYNGIYITSPPWKTGATVQSELLDADQLSYKEYLVTATDQYGCVGKKLVKVNCYKLPPVPQVTDTEFCAWEAINVAPENGGMNNWYQVTPPILIQSNTTTLKLPSFESNGQFQYQVEAISAQGCVSAKKTFTINVPLECDHRLNWIQTTTYDVAGPVAETRAYFDDAGGPLQTQTKTFSLNEILAAQGIKDQYGRNVISTLVAPVNQTSFRYKHWFVTNSAGRRYDHTMFGTPLGSSVQGTLGWYYSENNSVEDHVPVTGFPYAQHDYYEDGTGELRRSASPGEALKLGSGHEVVSGTFQVVSELDDYLAKRRLAGLADLQTDNTLKHEGVQNVMRDANGKYAVSLSDKTGNLVMSAREGTSSDHTLMVVNSLSATGTRGSPANVYFYLLRDQPVTFTFASSNQAPAPVPGIVYGDIIERSTYNNAEKELIAKQAIVLKPGFRVPSGNMFTAKILTGFTVENQLTGQLHTPGSGNWPAGFYKVTLFNGSADLSFTNYFTDVAYQFYDDAGRLASSVSPKGYSAWRAGATYSAIDKTTYEYNHQGWLLNTIEPDAGKTQYVYRKDGKIRFSQNAEQQTKNTFSYTHYDKLGRPVESGEYKGTAVSFMAMNATGYVGSAMQTQVDKTFDQVSWTDADKKDWVRTYYDLAVAAIDNLPSTFKQEFVRGAVARTENKNMKTWYSYDEFGRVTWMAQKPAALNRTFVTHYTYDFLGNVLDVQNVAYVDQLAINPFYHHYEYDADKRLSKVLTSTDGTTKKLRATYEYYLHGPLKRIELGDAIQGIDFVYNIQGWLTQINHPDKMQDPGGDENDAFGMVLDYYESAMNGIYQTSSIFESGNPERFHKVPGLPSSPTATSLAYKAPLLILKNELRDNLQQIKQGMSNGSSTARKQGS